MKARRLGLLAFLILGMVGGVSADSIFDGYEDGNVTDTWDPNPDFSGEVKAVTDPVYDGTYSAQFGQSGAHSNYAATWKLDNIYQPSSIEYYWQEAGGGI